MATFDVLSPLKRNEKLFAPGDTIEISDKEDEKALLDCVTIGVPGSYKKSLETMKTLEEKNKDQKDAIFKLQNENTNLKTELKNIASGQKSNGTSKDKAKG